MAIVYSYIRFSDKPQGKGDSVRRQRSMGDNWLRRHPEHTLDTTLRLTDLGVSAFRGANLDQEKGDLGRFIHLAKQGRIAKGSVLMLENLDRFSRQPPRKAYRIFCELVEAGVRVLTLDPEQLIDEKNIDNMEVILPVIIKMQLAFEESRKKAERLRAAWEGKRLKIGEQKLTSVVPRWLRLSEDRQRFELIPARVKVVRHIYQWAAEGMGGEAIVKRLNRTNVPPFGKARGGKTAVWHISYVKKILGNRAVLGEYQPHRFEDGKRVPVGEPVPDYFPAIIAEQDYYAAQRGKVERRQQPGRHGRRLTNLFTGLLRDARDGSPMGLVDKGNGPALVSSAAKTGRADSVYISFPYEPFERAILIWGYDLQLGDVLPKETTNVEEELHKAEGRITDLDHRIETVKRKVASAGNLEALLDTLVDLETKRREAHEEVERLKRERTTQVGQALDTTRELIDRLGSAPDDEAYGLRLKLRAMLKQLIRDIVVLVVQVAGGRVALADVQSQSGQRRRVTIMPGKHATLPEEVDKLDVREWKHWPEEYRGTTFEVVPDEVRRMIELEDKGASRTEIAKKLGVSKSRVSRSLRGQGRRKKPRKPADSKRLMSWHSTGRGWVKCHQGKRYFVAIGTLKRLYPRLVQEKTEEGSWRAANRWWKDQLAELERRALDTAKR